MPIYEYRCSNGHTFEVTQRMADDPVTECEVCGALVERVFHPVAVHFKGSGFYTTDYGSKTKSGASSEDGSGSGDAKGGSDSKSSSSDSNSSSDSKSSSEGSSSSSGGDSSGDSDGKAKASSSAD